MAKTKTARHYLPGEVELLEAIPKNRQTPSKLRKFASKTNRTYGGVYAKWKALYEAKQGSVGKTFGKAIPKLHLEVDLNYVPNNVRIDDSEVLALENELGTHVSKLLPFKGAITIPTRLQPIAKKYVEKHFPQHVYAFQAIGGTSKHRRLIRKV